MGSQEIISDCHCRFDDLLPQDEARARVAACPVHGGEVPDRLDLAELRKENLARAQRWHGGDSEPWSLADWSNAMCGEAGEAANIVKKIRRHETSVGSLYNTPDLDALGIALAEELADTIIYVDLLASSAGIDLSQAIRSKFNRVSEAQGFPERL